MSKFMCTLCEYIYDPEEGDEESGVEPKTSFKDLPGGWYCPLCGAGVNEFQKVVDDDEFDDVGVDEEQ